MKVRAGILALCVTAFLSALPGSAVPAWAQSGDEVWVTGQDTAKVFVVLDGVLIDTLDFSVLPGYGASSKPHYVTYTPDGSYAYIAFQGSGNVAVVRTADRVLVTTITIPVPAGGTAAGLKTTAANLSPDGSYLLVTNVGSSSVADSRKITKVLRTGLETYAVSTELIFPSTEGPTCVIFRPDGLSAYVSISPPPDLTGMHVIDPVAMSLGTFVETVGDPQCGIHPDGDTAVSLTTNGKTAANPGGDPGHIYRIDTLTNTMADITPSRGLRVTDLHDHLPVVKGGGEAKKLYLTSRGSDELRRVTLKTGRVDVLGVDPRPFILDKPDTIVTSPNGKFLFISMKESGDLAIVKNFSQVTFVPLAPPAAGTLPTHGVGIRPA
jgi:DNA-binding beta-propeller fold protein YncE